MKEILLNKNVRIIAIIIGVFLVAKFLKNFVSGILVALGLKTPVNPFDKVAETEKNNQYQAQPSTYSAIQMQTFADKIDNALNSEFWDNESEAVNVVKQMRNLSDVYSLIEFYGKRPTTTLFVIGFNDMDLPETLRSELSSSQLNEINQDFNFKGINYQF